jgi:hypothetical protein
MMDWSGENIHNCREQCKQNLIKNSSEVEAVEIDIPQLSIVENLYIYS